MDAYEILDELGLGMNKFGMPGNFNYEKAIATTLFNICQKDYINALSIAQDMVLNNVIMNNINTKPPIVVNLYYVAIIFAELANNDFHADGNLLTLKSLNADLYDDIIKIKEEACKGNWVYAKYADYFLYKATDFHTKL